MNGMMHLLSSMGLNTEELNKAILVIQQVGVKFAKIEEQLNRIEQRQESISMALSAIRQHAEPSFTPEENGVFQRALAAQTVSENGAGN